jgi:DNA-binding response OmpR family regulator
MGKSKGKILLVEDDKNLGFVIKDFLEMSLFHVTLKENGLSGLAAFREKNYDLILLDVMLPKMDGFTVAEEIRKYDCEVPLIFITARNMDQDRIKGFRTGADDYIVKPFSTEELKLRIRAIMRRTRYNPLAGKDTIYHFGAFTFNSKNHRLTAPSGNKQLTRREAEVLLLLCKNMNEILRREVALRSIWGEDDYFMGRSMDVYITKLRKILKEDPNVSITNIHNTGFKLEVHQVVSSE